MKERGKPVIVVAIHRRSRCLSRGRGCGWLSRATGETADESEGREETDSFDLFHNEYVVGTTARLLPQGSLEFRRAPTNRRQRRGRPRFSTRSAIGSR